MKMTMTDAIFFQIDFTFTNIQPKFKGRLN